MKTKQTLIYLLYLNDIRIMSWLTSSWTRLELAASIMIWSSEQFSNIGRSNRGKGNKNYTMVQYFKHNQQKYIF